MNQHLGVYTAIQLASDKNPAKENCWHPLPACQTENVLRKISNLWKPEEVAIGWSCDVPIRQLSQESLARLRRSRLRNKALPQFPAFGERAFRTRIGRAARFLRREARLNSQLKNRPPNAG
jgi:hypothetical protein